MGRLLAACLIGITLMVFIASPNVRGGEENDLWLILSSYEDISINVGDLAFFLATHGYNAIPKDNYVIVQFSSGNEVYLTPNGASHVSLISG